MTSAIAAPSLSPIQGAWVEIGRQGLNADGTVDRGALGSSPSGYCCQSKRLQASASRLDAQAKGMSAKVGDQKLKRG